MKIRTFIFAIIALLFFAKAGSHAQSGINLVVSLTGNVIDEVTKQPVGTEIEVFDEAGKRIAKTKSNSADGYYFITGLRPGKTYTLRNVVDIASSKRYFRHKHIVTIPQTESYQEYSKDIPLSPLGQNVEIPLKVTPFGVNKANIRPGSEVTLQRYIEDMKDNPRVKFEVVCFPDNTVDKNNNLNITNERAKKLKEFFVSNGITEDRITSSGNTELDGKVPPPPKRAPKGKQYKGTVYLVVKSY